MNRSILNLKNSLIFLIIFFGLIALIAFFRVVFDKAYFHEGGTINVELASKFGGFFGGFVGTLFSILSVLLIIYTMNTQSANNRKAKATDYFFKMVDYHNENVSNLSISHIDTTKDYLSEGRRAFVIYKIQLKRLLSAMKEININRNLCLDNWQVIDIAYMIFYYGLDKGWADFIKEKLARYADCQIIVDDLLHLIEMDPSIKIGRTNQTGLSGYFRNMYNAIKLIDEDKYLSETEKRSLIKIYRSQLSNPELYVLFYNLVSRFGYKWRQHNYVIKYEFLKNIPTGYADEFEPKEFFDLTYEDEEYDDHV